MGFPDIFSNRSVWVLTAWQHDSQSGFKRSAFTLGWAKVARFLWVKQTSREKYVKFLSAFWSSVWPQCRETITLNGLYHTFWQVAKKRRNESEGSFSLTEHYLVTELLVIYIPVSNSENGKLAAPLSFDAVQRNQFWIQFLLLPCDVLVALSCDWLGLFFQGQIRVSSSVKFPASAGGGRAWPRDTKTKRLSELYKNDLGCHAARKSSEVD